MLEIDFDAVYAAPNKLKTKRTNKSIKTKEVSELLLGDKETMVTVRYVCLLLTKCLKIFYTKS